MKIGKKHTRQSTTSNILKMYNFATIDEIKEGINWYTNANIVCSELSEETNRYSIHQIAGAISALSPRNKWSRNILDVRNLVKDRYCKVGTFHANRDKARAILDAFYPSPREIEEILRGQKTISFYRNIVDPNDPNYVTIDGHAIGIWLGQRVTNLTVSGDAYYVISQEYEKAAKKLGLIPNQLQAITWLTYKRIHKI